MQDFKLDNIIKYLEFQFQNIFLKDSKSHKDKCPHPNQARIQESFVKKDEKTQRAEIMLSAFVGCHTALRKNVYSIRLKTIHHLITANSLQFDLGVIFY